MTISANSAPWATSYNSGAALPWNTAQGGTPNASPWAASVEPAQGAPIGRQGSLVNALTGGAPSQGSIFQGLGSVFSGALGGMLGDGAHGGDAAATGGPGSPQSVPGGTPPGETPPGGSALGGLSLGGAAANTPSPMAKESPIVQGNAVGGHWNTQGFNSPNGGLLSSFPLSATNGGMGSSWNSGYGGMNMNPFMQRQG